MHARRPIAHDSLDARPEASVGSPVDPGRRGSRFTPPPLLWPPLTPSKKSSSSSSLRPPRRRPGPRERRRDRPLRGGVRRRSASILTPGCAWPFSPRSLRASAGSALRVPIVRARGSRGRGRLGARERRSPSPEPRPTEAARRNRRRPVRPLVLVVGSEGHGISASVAAALDLRLTLPARGARRVPERSRRRGPAPLHPHAALRPEAGRVTMRTRPSPPGRDITKARTPTMRRSLIASALLLSRRRFGRCPGREARRPEGAREGRCTRALRRPRTTGRSTCSDLSSRAISRFSP